MNNVDQITTSNDPIEVVNLIHNVFNELDFIAMSDFQGLRSKCYCK